MLNRPLKTILNRVEYCKSFVFGKARWVDDAEVPTMEVNIEARRNGRPICSGCGQARPGYDRLPERRFEFVPKHSRWCLLKRPQNLTEKQTVKLAELLQYNLKSVRSYLLREKFQRLWEYAGPGWAANFLDQWCRRTMRSKIEPMKKVARSLREHRNLILNWFRAKGTVSSGTVEGLNNKAQLITRESYGFRTQKACETARYHNLRTLPEPESTREFW